MKNILEVKNLTKTYNKKNPSIEISFDVKEGECLGFFGSNGAGKTTIINMLLGLTTQNSGQIKYFGKLLENNYSEIFKKTSFASPYSKLPNKLTVYENLDIHGRIHEIKSDLRKKIITEYLEFFELINLKNQYTGILSTGQLTKIMIIKAFISNPKIVLLDEPTASLDLKTAKLVRKFLLYQKNKNKISIIIASHNSEEINQLCDRILSIKNGKVIKILYPGTFNNQSKKEPLASLSL